MSLVSSHRTVFAAPASPVVSRVANRHEIYQRHRLAGESLAREFHCGVEEFRKAPSPYQKFNSIPQRNVPLAHTLGAVVSSSITVG